MYLIWLKSPGNSHSWLMEMSTCTEMGDVNGVSSFTVYDLMPSWGDKAGDTTTNILDTNINIAYTIDISCINCVRCSSCRGTNIISWWFWESGSTTSKDLTKDQLNEAVADVFALGECDGLYIPNYRSFSVIGIMLTRAEKRKVFFLSKDEWVDLSA